MVSQYTLKIAFAQCVRLMSEVVFQTVPSAGARYEAQEADIGFTRRAVYDKLNHVESDVSAALVAYSGKELLDSIRRLSRAPKAPLPGYRMRILDGDHLAGTEHRLTGLRRHRMAALPEQALVLSDPRYDVITNVIPCEDACTQERALLGPVLDLIQRNDCVVADRNFCTTGFLFGLVRKRAAFVIRRPVLCQSLDHRACLPTINGRSAYPVRHAGVSEGGPVRLKSGMHGVHRRRVGHSGFAWPVGSGLRGKPIVDVLPDLGSGS